MSQSIFPIPAPPSKELSSSTTLAKNRLVKRLVKSHALSARGQSSAADDSSLQSLYETKSISNVRQEMESLTTSAQPKEPETLPSPEALSVLAALNLLVNGDKGYLYLTTDAHNPYKLHVLPDSIDKDSFPGEIVTLSRNGIVRNEFGEMVHIGLKEYLNEFKLYEKLCAIPIFRDYRKW